MELYKKLVIWLVLVVLAVNLSACGSAYDTGVTVNNGLVLVPGMVEAIQTGTTLRGMLGCAQGVQGTSIMLNAKETLLLLSWTYTDGNVGFLPLNYAKETIMRNFGTTIIPGLPASGNVTGNIASFSTWRGLTDYLETQGWTYITPDKAIWTPLIVAISSWTSFISTVMPTFIFMMYPLDVDGYIPVLEDYYPPVELG